MRDEITALLPRRSLIGGPVGSTSACLSFDGCIDVRRVCGGCGKPDTPHIAAGEATPELCPGRAAIRGTVNTTLTAAPNVGIDVASALPAGGIHDVRILRIDEEVGDTGVFRNGEHVLPCLAAIRGAVETALAAGTPKRTLCGNPDGVRVAWVDDDFPDVFAGLEAHVLPGTATIFRLVDAIPPANTALGIVLTAADPDDIGAFWVDGDGPDGVRRFVIKDRRESRAVVGCLPDAAAGCADIPGGFVGWVDGDGNDAATGDRRADLTRGDGGKGQRSAACGAACRGLWTLLSGWGERRCKGYGGKKEGKRIHNWVTFSCPGGCVKPFKAQKSPVGLPGWFVVLNGPVSALRWEVK